MSDLTEKASFLKGLAEGCGVTDADQKDKLLLKLIDVIFDMTKSMEQMQNDIDDMNDYIESLEESVLDMEEIIYDDDDDDYEDYDFCSDCDKDEEACAECPLNIDADDDAE